MLTKTPGLSVGIDRFLTVFFGWSVIKIVALSARLVKTQQ